MKRRYSLLLSLLLLLSLFVPGPQPALHAAPVAETLTIDSTLLVDPLLQIGALLDPNRKVRVIVTKTSPLVSSTVIALAAGVPIVEEFPFIQSLVLELPQATAVALALVPGVRYVTYDSPIAVHAIPTNQLQTTYNQSVGATAVWNSTTSATQATGKGITVAVVDTGVDSDHPDLAGSSLVAVEVNKNTRSTRDGYGHGTHVIGVITGRDAQGRYIGVAPDARVISVKISDDSGAASETDLLRGLQWVYSHRSSYNIRVVNLSVSTALPQSYLTSPVAAAVEKLWDAGVVVVASSGNTGTEVDATWHAPGNDPFIITVGCLDESQTAATDDDRVCSFSSRGRTQDGFYKPDVVAPGRKIVSTLATGSILGVELPERITDESYLRLSGTSMSAPVVSGVVALLLQRYPRLDPDQVKWLLTTTGRGYPGQPDSAEAVDALAAMQKASSPERANRGLVPSLGINLLSAVLDWDKSYSNADYWDKSYSNATDWDKSYSNATSWDKSYSNSTQLD